MSNPLEKVGHAIKEAALAVKNAFVKLFGADAAKNFAQAAEQLLASNFGPVVLGIIENLNLTTLANDAKHAAAFTQIGEAAKSAGVTVADNIINLLIELGVAKVKGNLTALSS